MHKVRTRDGASVAEFADAACGSMLDALDFILQDSPLGE